jgi:hypothetical protein
MSFARAYAEAQLGDVLPFPRAIPCVSREKGKWDTGDSRLGYTGGLNPYRETSDSFVYPWENATPGNRARLNASASKYFMLALHNLMFLTKTQKNVISE